MILIHMHTNDILWYLDILWDTSYNYVEVLSKCSTL